MNGPVFSCSGLKSFFSQKGNDSLQSHSFFEVLLNATQGIFKLVPVEVFHLRHRRPAVLFAIWWLSVKARFACFHQVRPVVFCNFRPDDRHGPHSAGSGLEAVLLQQWNELSDGHALLQVLFDELRLEEKVFGWVAANG